MSFYYHEEFLYLLMNKIYFIISIKTTKITRTMWVARSSDKNIVILWFVQIGKVRVNCAKYILNEFFILLKFQTKQKIYTFFVIFHFL